MSGNFSLTQVKEWLIENLPYKIMWMDEEGRIVYANVKFLERLGYHPSEITHLTIFDINPHTNKEGWKEHWQEVKLKEIHRFKAVHQTKQGNYYDVEVYAQFFSNNGKDVICAMVNEISESSFYKNLLNHTERITMVGGWKYNLQDESIVVTKQAQCIFDTDSTESFHPTNVISFFEEKEALKKHIDEALTNGIPYDETFTLRLKDNVVKYVRCVGEPIVKGKKIYKLIGAYQDVTEETLKARELSSFKYIIENTKDYIYFLDEDFQYRYANQAAVDFAGLSHRELLEKDIYYFYPKVTDEESKSIVDSLQETGKLDILCDYENESGTVFFDITYLKVDYLGEDLICAIGRDITDLKRSEERLRNTLNELSELKNELEIDNQYLKEEINSKINFENIICRSESYRRVLEQVTRVAVTDSTVLITGESGTGKELLASAVHMNSRRKDRALIKVNCATLPKELIESELFGHKKGSFTGAVSDKPGKFSLADGGTIFLDEIGEVPMDLQSKLLRVLQEGEFDQLGATTTSKVDVRVIAATNRNLEEMVNEGKFREDLYYRLNVFPIRNIPLRERKEDIPMLAQFFLEKYAAKAGKSFKRLSKKTIDQLMRYPFPGNIRELENLIERAVIIEDGTTLFPGDWMPAAKTPNVIPTAFKSFDEMQRDYIYEVLLSTNGKVSGAGGAAEILKMKDKTLFAKMKKLGIEKKMLIKKDE